MLYFSRPLANTTYKLRLQDKIDMIDDGKIVLRGGFRLPARTIDSGTIRLGGGFRLPIREG